MNNDQLGSVPGLDVFTRMWSDFATQMMKSGMTFSPNQTPPQQARDMRSAMFSSWSEYCEQFMRSDEFLGSMKQSMASSVQFRKQLNDFLGQTQHEFQGASRQDVDQIMSSLRRTERRTVDAMERLSDQLEGMSERLDKLEKKSQGGNKKSTSKKSARNNDD